MGLHELTTWAYHAYQSISESPDKSFSFYNTCSTENGAMIIAEDIVHDLGGRERVRHYLATHTYKDRLLNLFFVSFD